MAIIVPLTRSFISAKVATDRRASKGFVGAVSAGLCLLAHVLLINAALNGYSSYRPRAPHQPGIGASAVATDTAPTLTLIFLDERGVGALRDNPPEEMASKGQGASNPFLNVSMPKSVADSAKTPTDNQRKEASAAADSASDHLGQAVLFGLYMSQIQARVERAWLRPRIPIGAESFSCHVQIQQSPRGEVLEVTLRECNGDLHWQLSLVKAIERASPLPAPPDPAVFTDSLRLSFHSGSYVSGSGDEGFEPAARVLAAAAAPPQYFEAQPPEASESFEPPAIEESYQ